MNPGMRKALFEAWIKSTIKPTLEEALKNSIPIESIAGTMLGLLVVLAKRAGWTKEQLVELVQTQWGE